MKRLIAWCKNNIDAFFVFFLAAFIPLYPKLPAVDIYGTWVSIRLEDFFVLFALLYVLSDVVKKRKLPESSLTTPILWYWIIGALSLAVSLLFIGPKLANYFPHLAVLHYIRRIEYMAVFFIGYRALKNRKNLPILIGVLSLTVIAVMVYGLGQKILGWPAYLTMNEEFAKGIPLRLPATARIPSTFGGHYDLAAYLVFIIPVFLSLVFSVKKVVLKLFFTMMFIGSLGMLLLTASRVSFGVYLAAVTVLLIWIKKKMYILPVVIVSFVMLNMVSSASERFYKTFRFSDVIVDLSTGRPIGTLDKLEGGMAYVENQENPAVENLPKGTEFINVPQSQLSDKTAKTIQVFRKSPLATGSGEIATVSGSFLIQKALVYDISMTTRFQGQWPKAIEAFKRNVLVGSGYSTLSVASDGDYLRMLGETGILGTISFLGIFAVAFTLFFRYKKSGTYHDAYISGLFAGFVGLFLNALLIDVFEASKVAFTVWLLLGAAAAIMESGQNTRLSYGRVLVRVCTSNTAVLLGIAGVIWYIWGPVLSMYFVADDFTWLKWASSSTVGDIVGYFSNADGFFYRPIPKIWYFLMYSVFWLKASSYHVVTMLLYAYCAIAIYSILRILHVRVRFAVLGAVLFGLLSVHHENIFWISGASSLLSGVFLITSVWMMLHKRSVIRFLSSLFIFLSMLSYEGGFFAPIAIWFISTFIGKHRWDRYVWLLLLMPVYWYMRLSSGALFQSGDYAYNPTKLLFNIPANTVAYVGSVFGGPVFIDWMSTVRLQMKAYPEIAGIILSIVCITCVFLIGKFKQGLVSSKQSVVFLVAGIFMLVPYLGLGGAADRYLFSASLFFAMGLALFVERIFNNSDTRKKVFLSVCILAMVWWNMRQITDLSSQWSMAHDMTKRSLLKMKTEFFPIRIPTLFVFVDIPAKYGHAWVYPNGVDDALWHLFRGSQYSAITAPDLPTAFTHSIKGAMYVLQFDSYQLNRVEMDTEVVYE